MTATARERLDTEAVLPNGSGVLNAYPANDDLVRVAYIAM
jgi:hypothetical protein